MLRIVTTLPAQPGCCTKLDSSKDFLRALETPICALGPPPESSFVKNKLFNGYARAITDLEVLFSSELFGKSFKSIRELRRFFKKIHHPDSFFSLARARDSERRMKALMTARENAIFHLTTLNDERRLTLSKEEFLHFDFFVGPLDLDGENFMFCASP
jgi:hypothetical protein